jgi:putative Mn2+ efflux pump MntP
MPTWTVVVLGIGLAIDSTLVALALGLRAGPRRKRAALAIGAAFGLTHGVLTLLGAGVGEQVAGWFADFDHWIAFAVLGALGLKAIVDVQSDAQAPPELSALAVALASLATSLDGVAVGFGLALASKPAGPVALSAGIATAVGAALAFSLGRSVPVRARKVAQVLAGLLLIAIGASIVFEHRTTP